MAMATTVWFTICVISWRPQEELVGSGSCVGYRQMHQRLGDVHRLVVSRYNENTYNHRLAKRNPKFPPPSTRLEYERCYSIIHWFSLAENTQLSHTRIDLWRVSTENGYTCRSGAMQATRLIRDNEKEVTRFHNIWNFNLEFTKETWMATAIIVISLWTLPDGNDAY